MGGGMLGQLLGSVLSGRGTGGGLGGSLGGLGGGLGGLGQEGGASPFGGISAGPAARGMGSVRGMSGESSSGGYANKTALMMMLLPLAMQWVQRSGGLGSVVQRFGQRGYGPQASSWVGTGDNQSLDPQSLQDVMGRDEIARMSQETGMPEDEVRGGMAEILPELVNQATPQGQVTPDADDRIGRGLQALLGGLGRGG